MVDDAQLYKKLSYIYKCTIAHVLRFLVVRDVCVPGTCQRSLWSAHLPLPVGPTVRELLYYSSLHHIICRVGGVPSPSSKRVLTDHQLRIHQRGVSRYVEWPAMGSKKQQTKPYFSLLRVFVWVSHTVNTTALRPFAALDHSQKGKTREQRMVNDEI